MVTIISIPRTGTRFFLYFCMYVLGLKVTYIHLFKGNVEKIKEIIASGEVIIVPMRSYEGTDESFKAFPKYHSRFHDEFLPLLDELTPSLITAGAHFMNTEKGANTHQQFDDLLTALGMDWTPEITDYIDKWEKVGSQYTREDKKSKRVITALIRLETFEYPGELQPLIKWAVNRNQANNVQVPPDPFPEWVAELMPEECRGEIHYWVGVVSPDSKLSDKSSDWVDGYPHTHVNSVGWRPSATTVMLYLTVADDGGEIAIGGDNEDDEYTLIKPYPGMAVRVDAVTWHGVKPVKSGTRIALITTGFDYDVFANND